MNDWWNDPPEPDDPPDCPECGEPPDLTPSGHLQCEACKLSLVPPRDYSEAQYIEQIPWTDDSERMVHMGDRCPHGNPWFNCDTCDHNSDLAYDAQRESSR